MDPPIAKGYESLNDVIDFSGVELLNASSSDPSAQARVLLGDGASTTTSDADSQLLLFVPFQNRVQIASVFIKPASSGQVPSRVKAWGGLTAPLSFEDAEQQKGAFDGPVPDARSAENGNDDWRELKLRFVLFQNVASLLLFIDGDDENEMTSLDRIVIVGRKGESRSPGALRRPEDDD